MNTLRGALANAGIPEPSKDTETFKMIRWGRNNRYWLKKFDGGYVFGDFVKGFNSHVFEGEYCGKRLKSAQNRLSEAMKSVQSSIDTVNKLAADKAATVWAKSEFCSDQTYTKNKKIGSFGLKMYKNSVIVPLYDVSGKLWSLQFIDGDGNKRFLSGGKKKGCFFTIGSLDGAKQVFMCEGYATGASVYESIDQPVVVAFDAGNLKPVAEALRKKYRDLQIFICADNDCYGENGLNVGVEKANETAQSVGGHVIIPRFNDTSTNPTDFNDLFVLEGKDAVRAVITEAVQKVCQAQPDVPASFILSDDGLFCVDKRTEQPIRISNYIKVIAFTKSDDEVSRLVEFKDYKGNKQTLVIKSGMFSKDGEQIRIALLKHGFIFVGSALSKRKLTEYIASSVPSKELSLVSRIGFFDDVYVRPDCVVGKSSEEVVLDTAIRDESCGTAGNLQDWNDHVARWCVGNSRLVFAISTAFASTLLHHCNMPNFGFHIVGNSSSGKTTCLHIAASVYGNPKYVVTWKATDNAMENMAFRRNDSLLILDELSEISPSKAGEVAYMLANGQGKKRLDKNCNARETMSWHLIFLSSGEIDLDSHMAEERKNSKAGQKIRLLNISAKASKDSFGIFENLMGFQDGAEFSNYLREKAARYYGVPSIEFIKHILAHNDQIKTQFREEFQQLKARYLPEKSEGQDMRAFEKFMFVGFAGELAIKWNIVCWNPGTAYVAAISCFNSWLEDKEGVGDDENRQILEHVKAFFELHGHSRFFDLNGFKDQKVPNMAGYKLVYKDAVTFFVSPSIFKNEICRKFNRKAVINLLIDKGFMLKDHNGDYRQQKWTPDGNRKVYVISGEILL